MATQEQKEHRAFVLHNKKALLVALKRGIPHTDIALALRKAEIPVTNEAFHEALVHHIGPVD